VNAWNAAQDPKKKWFGGIAYAQLSEGVQLWMS
jgi:hypothetical protein